MTTEDIRLQAVRELALERTRLLVDAEIARIRAQSPWARFLAWLPFTITITRKH